MWFGQAFGVRFDDRVTGKLESFASHARIVHVDIDPAEIHKNKTAHIPLCADAGQSLKVLNAMLDADPVDPQQFEEWRAELERKREQFPMSYPQREDVIVPQWAIKVCCLI